jgi:hypothetical protein
MVTLFIAVGIYVIECFGSSCYSIDRVSLNTLITVGVAEMVYEIPNVLKIYRKRDGNDKP